jgi:hypothetical protein
MLFSALLLRALVLQAIFSIIHPLGPLRKGYLLKALVCHALILTFSRERIIEILKLPAANCRECSSSWIQLRQGRFRPNENTRAPMASRWFRAYYNFGKMAIEETERPERKPLGFS